MSIIPSVENKRVDFTIGDYDYIVISGTDVYASAHDLTKASYDDVPESFTYNDVTYTVIGLLAVYYNRRGAAYIRNNIGGYVEGANAAASALLQGGFQNCVNMLTSPQLPDSITRMQACFEGCTSLQTVTNIPQYVTSLERAFYNCRALASVPPLPAGIVNLNECFAYAFGSTANVTAQSVPNYAVDIFTGVTSDIYIVNGTGAENIATAWRAISANYSTVHYEADDNPNPALSFSVLRVGENGSTTFVRLGEYVYIRATVTVFDTYIPVGWTNGLGETTLYVDDDEMSPEWATTYSEGVFTLQGWIDLGDIATHRITLQVADSIKAANVEKYTKLTAELYKILSKAYALVDKVHDMQTGEEGVAIGRYAVPGLFYVDMDSTFKGAFNFDLNPLDDTDAALIKIINSFGFAVLTGDVLDVKKMLLSMLGIIRKLDHRADGLAYVGDCVGSFVNTADE